MLQLFQIFSPASIEDAQHCGEAQSGQIRHAFQHRLAVCKRNPDRGSAGETTVHPPKDKSR